MYKFTAVHAQETLTCVAVVKEKFVCYGVGLAGVNAFLRKNNIAFLNFFFFFQLLIKMR